MDKVWNALSDYRVAFAGLGTALLLLSLFASVTIRGHSVALDRAWKRWICGIVGMLFISTVILAVITGAHPASKTPATKYFIGGEWAVTLRKGDSTTRAGFATICQEAGSELIDLSMRTESRSLGPGRYFTFTATGRLKGPRLVLYYDTPRGDRGLYLGDLQVLRPSDFSVRYSDIFDTNNDSTGDIEFRTISRDSVTRGC